jgi:hypothetical protein
MARGATLSLDGRMLVNEWAEGVDMAFGADGVLGRSGSEEFGLESAVRVMAVGALQ